MTDKYIESIPSDSRVAKAYITKLQSEDITDKYLQQIQGLKAIAFKRNQSIAQVAIAWALRHPSMCSVLIGASKPEQIIENVKALENLEFTVDELKQIDKLFPLQ